MVIQTIGVSINNKQNSLRNKRRLTAHKIFAVLALQSITYAKLAVLFYSMDNQQGDH